MSLLKSFLMSQNKIMYATIKGTLTENDGVFSGFSASNYLLLQQQFQPANKNWEIVIKTEITQLNVVQTIIGSSTNTRNIQLTIRDTNIIRFYRTTDGTAEVVVNSSLTIDSLGVYYFKISFNGSQYKVSVSQNGNNYIDYIVSPSSTPIYNNSPALSFAHNGRSTSEYFRGSIDLPNSYIKLGSTKYNLQAVVGYTIVGSPTIVDGVVSGFSSANYLKIDKTITANKIEISVPFSLSAKGWNDIFWGDTSSQIKLLVETNPSESLNLYFTQGISSAMFVTNYAVDTQYRLNFVITYDTFSYKLINEDTNIIVKKATIERTTKANPYLNTPAFGRSAPNTTIPIKDSWIKIDNKLWFNGQQA